MRRKSRNRASNRILDGLTVEMWRELRLGDEPRAARLTIAAVNAALHSRRLRAADANDVRSETLLRIWRAPTVSGDPPFRTWVASILNNVASEFWRRHQRDALPEDPDDPEADLATLPCPRSGSGEDAVDGAEAHAALLAEVRRIVAELPRPHGQIIEWQVVNGFTRATIRRLLMAWGGISDARAHNLFTEAHAHLRSSLLGHDLRTLRPRLFSKKPAWNSPPPQGPEPRWRLRGIPHAESDDVKPDPSINPSINAIPG